MVSTGIAYRDVVTSSDNLQNQYRNIHDYMATDEEIEEAIENPVELNIIHYFKRATELIKASRELYILTNEGSRSIVQESLVVQVARMIQEEDLSYQYKQRMESHIREKVKETNLDE